MKNLLILFAIILSVNSFAQEPEDDDNFDSVTPIYFLDSIYIKYKITKLSIERSVYDDVDGIADMLYDNNEIRIATDEDLSMLLSDSIARLYKASKEFNSKRQLNNVFNLTGTNNALPTFRNAKAGGGKVQAGSPVLVGERGMEMFVPDTGGRIMNNMNTKNSMGGGTTVINQSINFATGVVPTVRAEVMKMMPQIAEVTKGAVAEAAMRGGNYRRMLQGG